jgi:hypothetical protein
MRVKVPCLFEDKQYQLDFIKRCHETIFNFGQHETFNCGCGCSRRVQFYWGSARYAGIADNVHTLKMYAAHNGQFLNQWIIVCDNTINNPSLPEYYLLSFHNHYEVIKIDHSEDSPWCSVLTNAGMFYNVISKNWRRP